MAGTQSALSTQPPKVGTDHSCAAAAKSLQSCPTLCDPIDGSLPGSSIHGILQARTLEWVAIFFSNAWKWKVKVKSLSRVWLLVTPRTVGYQAPPSMGFSRQEYWSVVPLPSPIPVLQTAYPRHKEVKYIVQPLHGSQLWHGEGACITQWNYEPWRIDAFKLWCWRRLLRVPWTARRSNQSILKGINPEYLLEGLMMKLKLQYFGHLMQRVNSLEKTLMLGKSEDGRRRGKQRRRSLDSITDSMDMNLSKLQETVEDREAWHATDHGVPKNRTRLSDWTTASIVQVTHLWIKGARTRGLSGSLLFNVFFFLLW